MILYYCPYPEVNRQFGGSSSHWPTVCLLSELMLFIAETLQPFFKSSRPIWGTTKSGMTLYLTFKYCELFFFQTLFLFLYNHLTHATFTSFALVLYFIKWSKGNFWKVWCALVPICRPTINRPAAYACSCLIGNCSALSQCCRASVTGGEETCEWWVYCLKLSVCWMFSMDIEWDSM